MAEFRWCFNSRAAVSGQALPSRATHRTNPQRPAVLATSAAKSLGSFSTPSPRGSGPKGSTSMLGRGNRLGDGLLGVDDEILREEDDLLEELPDPALDHLGDDRLGLPLSRLLGETSRSRSITPGRPRPRPCETAPRRCASPPACRAVSRRHSSATSTPILPRPAAPRCARRARRAPCDRPTIRRSCWFSPIVATLLVDGLSTVLPPTGSPAQRLDVVEPARASVVLRTRPWKSSLRATKSVSELTSTSDADRPPP